MAKCTKIRVKKFKIKMKMKSQNFSIGTHSSVQASLTINRKWFFIKIKLCKNALIAVPMKSNGTCHHPCHAFNKSSTDRYTKLSPKAGFQLPYLILSFLLQARAFFLIFTSIEMTKEFITLVLALKILLASKSSASRSESTFPLDF